MKVYLSILTLFLCSITFAQTTISGNVVDGKNQPVPGANIKIVGEAIGAVTDFDGNFTLSTQKKPPFTIEVSSIGFSSTTTSISANNQKVSVTLNEEETRLDEIVISASRAPERVRESPVTIERMTIRDIKNTASPSFYDGLENLKEVHMNTSSMSFKSINTRGFATVANTRFMQLVDGMDNSSPLLNFVLGNLIGVSEIDVAGVELLPGASSALYGANAFNGILFMTSKSPFDHQGVSAYGKYGFTSQEAAGSNEYYDYGVRVAKAFSPKFAAKANFTFMSGTDWYATDYRDRNAIGDPTVDRSKPNYDGVNVYGDVVSTNIKSVASGLLNAGAMTPAQFAVFDAVLPNMNVSRTGYNEVDLTDNQVRNAKVDFSLHYRPFANDIEVIWQSKFGFGNTVYQGANRYYLNGFTMQQHKLEVMGKNFFVRGYVTMEDGGNSYDMEFTGININRQWKPDATWFGQYAGAFVQSTLGAVPGIGTTPQEAHAYARTVADTGRFLPGTPEYIAAFNQVTANPDVLVGSKLVDNSRIYHSDANYNFRDIIKFAEIQVGGSYRLYDLNSFGRIYTDTPEFGGISYNEYGAYTQLQKKFLDDKFKFTGSVRYDKAQNFDGNVSPRVSLVFSPDAQKKHNFRGSFQTGFRNPTTQDQYIGFNVGNAVLIGSAPDNLDRYRETLPVSTAIGQAFAGGNSVVITGQNAYFNSYTASSVRQFAALAGSDPLAAAALLRRTNVDLVKPETVKAFELGYRGQVDRISIDINGYYNIYNDFIGNLNVLAPLYGVAQDSPSLTGGPTDLGTQSVHAIQTGNVRAFQLYTNTDIEIQSIGFGAGLSSKVYKDFELGANYNFADFSFDQALDPSFEAGFNTPKHRVKGSISNDRLFTNFGFNLSARWNSEYLWESTMVDGVIEAATVVDAQINYSIPKLKMVIKAGGTNLGGQEYRQVLGAGLIGQQFFVGVTINQ
jgi:outer membrane receptor protein involved in Fe transport